MRRDQEQILCILAEATEPLFASEITYQLNKRLFASMPYSNIQVVMVLTALGPQLEQDSQGRWMLKGRLT